VAQLGSTTPPSGLASHGTGPPSTAGSSTSPSAVAYSACMRSHGVPTYPDPDSNGQLPKTDTQRLGVSSTQLQAAQHACQSLLPSDTGGSLADQAHQCMESGVCPPALLTQMLTAQRMYAQCIRSHGYPKFPDPTLESQGRPGFQWSVGQTGIDPHSTQFEAQDADCLRLGGLGGPRAVSP
jgi:hypothetical protein